MELADGAATEFIAINKEQYEKMENGLAT